MNNTVLGVFAAVIVVGGGWYFYMHKQPTVSVPSAELFANADVYPYVCDNGARFTMAPSADMMSITLTPAVGATFTQVSLKHTDSSAGARYEGSGIVFVGAGEGVALTVGNATLKCNPEPNQELAPFNWGDAGEGGGSVKQDTSLIVTENMLGKWESTDDAKFVREFKAGDVMVDWYGNESKSAGLWVVFTKEKAPKVFPYPMDPKAVYVQITMSGTQADTLNFAINKITPDELQMTYLDRGGVLNFKRVQ